jgi:hypothetical protein
LRPYPRAQGEARTSQAAGHDHRSTDRRSGPRFPSTAGSRSDRNAPAGFVGEPTNFRGPGWAPPGSWAGQRIFAARDGPRRVRGLANEFPRPEDAGRIPGRAPPDSWVGPRIFAARGCRDAARRIRGLANEFPRRGDAGRIPRRPPPDSWAGPRIFAAWGRPLPDSLAGQRISGSTSSAPRRQLRRSLQLGGGGGCSSHVAVCVVTGA